MIGDVDILHHVGVLARDLDGLARQYQRLGFLLTPLSEPRIPLQPGGAPERLGAANRCAIFRNNYLELLGIIDSARWEAIDAKQRGPFDIDPPLRRYEGLHVLHLGANDLEVVRQRLLAHGLNPSEIRPFQRNVDTPDGPQTMRAKSLSLPSGSVPEALFQIAQHETPELVLQPRYMQHPNGAQSITGVILCVENPAEVAERYATYSGHGVARSGGIHAINLGFSRLCVVSREGLSQLLPAAEPSSLPFLAGISISADLSIAQAYFREAAIAFTERPREIQIAPTEAAGVFLVFEEPSVQATTI